MCPKSVDPCGRTAETEDSCSPQPQGAQQPDLQLSSVLATWVHQQVVGFQQVVDCNNTPLSTPMPFTAAFVPDPGLKTALPLASVQGVSSTSIHGDGSGISESSR